MAVVVAATARLMRLRSIDFSAYTTSGCLARTRHLVLRLIIVALGPRRVIQILHETGAIYPQWGCDSDDAPYFSWVESRPPDEDEAERG